MSELGRKAVEVLEEMDRTPLPEMRPCTPPASPSSAEPAGESAPRRGGATAGGACCGQMTWMQQCGYVIDMEGLLALDFGELERRAKIMQFCPWCGEPLGRGEGE